MSEDAITDDQSHYEVSLTAGQAFLAFVLLLLSLAASFAFGLMIGKGKGDDDLLAQSTASIQEAGAVSRNPQERVVELGVTEDEAFSDSAAKSAAKPPARTAPKRAAAPIRINEEPKVDPASAATPKSDAALSPAEPGATSRVAAAPGPAVPHYAQLLSTTDQTKAEAFAAKLIDGGFMSAYVERSSNAKGPLFRVRVNFRSEQEARTAEPKLKTFSKDVWITKQ